MLDAIMIALDFVWDMFDRRRKRRRGPQ